MIAIQTMSSPLAILNYPLYALLGLISLTIGSGLIHRWSLGTLGKFVGLAVALPVGTALVVSILTYLVTGLIFGRYELHGTPVTFRQDIETFRFRQRTTCLMAFVGFICGGLVDLYWLICA